MKKQKGAGRILCKRFTPLQLSRTQPDQKRAATLNFIFII